MIVADTVCPSDMLYSLGPKVGTFVVPYYAEKKDEHPVSEFDTAIAMLVALRMVLLVD